MNTEAVEIKDCSIYNGEEVKCSNTSNCFYDTILNKITEISESDVKVKKGLTKKVLFKCLDITDELDD